MTHVNPIVQKHGIRGNALVCPLIGTNVMPFAIFPVLWKRMVVTIVSVLATMTMTLMTRIHVIKG